MAKYFIDTEFLEGTQKKLFSKTKPTIDLISIGIVDENGKEFYAISKDFNLKEAWNRWEPRTGEGDRNNTEPRKYWIRDNILYPIWLEYVGGIHKSHFYPFTYGNMKKFFKTYGKSNKEIAKDILEFICPYEKASEYAGVGSIDSGMEGFLKMNPPEFYGYYSSYDWTVFCWLFGRMIDLPKGFPMYCKDLKQILDEKVQKLSEINFRTFIYSSYLDKNPPIVEDKNIDISTFNFNQKLEIIKAQKGYPKQTIEHNALADAKWNLALYNFLNKLK